MSSEAFVISYYGLGAIFAYHWIKVEKPGLKNSIYGALALMNVWIVPLIISVAIATRKEKWYFEDWRKEHELFR